MHRPQTIVDLLAPGADDDIAIAACADARPALSYAALRRHMAATTAALNGFGIGRHDRVAIVLPNGPEMATAFLCVAAGATTAPLNPGYREAEFAFYLRDLDARALILEAGEDGPAGAAAAALDIPVIALRARSEAAGLFDLVGDAGAPPAVPGPAEAGDTALVLHTSGTTSRLKIVPLSQRNLCASARNIVASLALTPADVCLNIMPLFHIHGLMAAVLSSLAAGASVHCSPGFNALRFFAWMARARPSWYTAVPTMHQAILARAARNRSVVAGARLRLIRSSSASLPPQVMAGLEDAFGAPVIESYGMTEASHQMACNPLPPAIRKPGTVGRAAGPEVGIMGEDGMGEGGALLPPGAVGEIVIRGDNVTAGYEKNPAANAAAFTDGWFRTGDQGVLDAEGYLSITGRLKEIINRGGEKVSPREVDDVLLDHPAVAQALTFAMPHVKLGEEVAAVVVLRQGARVDARALRDFVAARLAAFKVPRRIVFVDEIPKGATGKPQRIGLADKLGLAGDAPAPGGGEAR